MFIVASADITVLSWNVLFYLHLEELGNLGVNLYSLTIIFFQFPLFLDDISYKGTQATYCSRMSEGFGCTHVQLYQICGWRYVLFLCERQSYNWIYFNHYTASKQHHFLLWTQSENFPTGRWFMQKQGLSSLHGPCLSVWSGFISVFLYINVWSAIFYQWLGSWERHTEAGMWFVQRCVSLTRDLSVKTWVLRKINEYRCTIFFRFKSISGKSVSAS